MKNILTQNQIKAYEKFSGPEFKEELTTNQILYMLNRSNEIFKYENLPKTIPKRNLELITQITGFSCWTKVNGELYVFWGGLGGEPNEYYEPTICTVANPYLKFSKNLKIDKDCVIMRNDANFVGLMPMFKRYSTLLTENTISMRLADINARTEYLLSADNENSKESAEEYLKKIIDGDLGVIGDQAVIFNGTKTQAKNFGANTITQLIEMEQYLKGSWYNEIGIDANFNMKREALNTSETSQVKNSLNTLLLNMLECRQDAVEKINNMFGTNIKVDFSPEWKANWDDVGVNSNEQRTIENQPDIA